MITFRELRGEDVEMLADRLADDAAGTARISVGPQQWWKLVHGDPRRHGWIVENHGEAVGYLDAQMDVEPAAQANTVAPPEVVYLAMLLFPVHRGRGLSRDVLRQALKLPKLAAAQALVAYVEPDNQAARRALLRVGFVETCIDPDGLIEHRSSSGDTAADSSGVPTSS